jgi:hypothetical protein
LYRDRLSYCPSIFEAANDDDEPYIPSLIIPFILLEDVALLLEVRTTAAAIHPYVSVPDYNQIKLQPAHDVNVTLVRFSLLLSLLMRAFTVFEAVLNDPT